ncbi:MAG: L-histidine N(alpha)-methyltransferase [Balneolaceae bacterium]
MNTAILEKKASSEMLADVLQGLKKPQKTVPSKYFYDKRGSELFEQICKLDEYYPTRTELSIMSENVEEIAELLGPNTQLVELGSGSSLKTRLLLDNLTDIDSYLPVDISTEFLADVTNELQSEYPSLNILPVAADYTQSFSLPETAFDSRRIAYYPGSTIGNFTKERAAAFLSLIAGLLGEKGGLLIGFDLLKEKEILIETYDDTEGVTAEFNKNILLRMNRDLNANFNPDAFCHKAIFNEDESRIEMHLVSQRDQVVDIMGTVVAFSKGESIHTENSHKYSLESFRDITAPHFEPVKTWMDKNELFAVQFLTK